MKKCRFTNSIFASVFNPVFVSVLLNSFFVIGQKCFLIILLIFSLVCCNSIKNNEMDVVGNIDVQILSAHNTDSENNTNNTSYEFKVVQLLDVYSLPTLSGKYVRFYTHASRENNDLQGDQPKAYFLRSKNGYYVPRDTFSMQLATLYYHTQNMALLDEKIGASEVNALPRKVVIGTPTSQENLKENNALYEGELDAIIYLPYNDESLPIPMNAGIYAHEYFHSLFYKIVLSKLNHTKIFKEDTDTLTTQEVTEEKNRLLSIRNYFQILLKGFNEGIADFWGWSYTNDPEFIRYSIPKVGESRTLSLKTQNLDSPKLLNKNELLAHTQLKFESNKDEEAHFEDFAYKLGTRVALTFKELVPVVQESRKISLEESKLTIMKGIYKLLGNLTKELLAFDQKFSSVSTKDSMSNLPSAYDFFYTFLSEFSMESEKECLYFANLLKKDGASKNSFYCSQSTKDKKNFELKRLKVNQ